MSRIQITCHIHLVLSTCLIALVVVAVNITKSKNIIVGHVVSEGDKALKCLWNGNFILTCTICMYVQYFANNSLRQTREHLQPVRQMRLTIVIILEVYGLFEV